MTHNEKRGVWWKEGLIGLSGGALFGMSSVALGHPFDTIKTKMQAQTGFENRSMLLSFKKTLQSQGIRGLYRGCIPPLFGSGIYRSTQFGAYEATYTYLGNHSCGRYEIPFSGGLQVRVIGGGIAGGTIRAIIETPLEYAKIRQQTQQSWQLRHMYSGLGVTWLRSVGLLTSFFIIFDTTRRHFPDTFSRPILGPYLSGSISATFAWWVVWPLEYMKSQVQADYGQNIPVLQRMRNVIRAKGGIVGLYRGIGPGTLRSFVANGPSLIVYIAWQRKVTEWGLRT
jgi:solute carrier family 25 carnitine/acylcarnitine transporter 20/29